MFLSAIFTYLCILLEILWKQCMLVFLWFVLMVVSLNLYAYSNSIISLFHSWLLSGFQACVGLHHVGFIVLFTGSLWLPSSAVWLTITHLLAFRWLRRLTKVSSFQGMHAQFSSMFLTAWNTKLFPAVFSDCNMKLNPGFLTCARVYAL